ncbi:MAG TPA: hybrid sensor histidine kinase/response regulator [Cyanobacteria bacterium UBA11159]|nr:hybrid sensor histidine kinase/response regulator [Cyanobacteria bacterium UBA11366]HBK64156.1 hybrid sensor histidine kinase/response regulator [Cyanobacteria bacterium UBA11166]HBR75334.1 hybrid sensor histidine kinase/response regulator [Cyanobacteria bacterium UBA11159]HBS70480.1 hybrid sensor histidine kinase/response regulator [Cyanobacteria bacterium UBA11153]HCA97278.1 hybrid sensor histidine kinase/response regulator [Cyanobacteria bacterium UBA9226]
MKKPSILIVDDEPDNFDVIEALLDSRYYQLYYASHGQEAIESLEIFNPDLILLDVMMPYLDGIEVCKQIKALPQWQEVPIIMVTALSDKEDLAQCLKAGADDFISKPVNGLEFRARVHSMLRIKQHYDDLQELIKLREDMVNMMVHDLRNPLTNILLGLDIIEKLNLPPEAQKAKLIQVRSSSQRLQLLIDNLLLMAKLESGKISLNLTQTSIGDLVPLVLAEFQELAAQKNIKIIIDIPESDRIITVDMAMFRRVLDNILSNAIKFSPRQSQIVFGAEYLVSGGVNLRIADVGPGVPDELRQRIFDKYEIGTIRQDVAQIGLGLAFCKVVVEAHGGNISIEGNHPQGSIFVITLPK